MSPLYAQIPPRAPACRRPAHAGRAACTSACRGKLSPGPLSLPKASLALTLAALLPLAACRAQRTLRITSAPSESEVRLDGERVGVTPLEISFEHYGKRRLSIYREGYRTYSRLVELDPPWYGRFPLDIVTEVLVPIGWRDHHEVHVNLQPGVAVLLEPDLQDILDRAEAMRRAGPEGPLRKPARATVSTKPARTSP
jgi:hypothetical protein